jgi:hypothetical protein
MYKHKIYLKAYPEHISHITDTAIVWKDDTKMLVSDGRENQKTFFEKLNDASLLDQISLPYIAGPNYIDTVKQKDFDPGRITNFAFLKKMYGHTKEEVIKNLVEIEWLPKSLKKLSPNGSTTTYKLLVTKINGISEKLKKISEELDNLFNDYKYLNDPGGTFCWRVVAGTNRLSLHSFGIAIDINVEYSNYWLWDYKKELGIPSSTNVNEEDIDYNKFPAYRNQTPWKIVEIFEKNNFIWGGKWFHYDTMHFEYRPELFLEHFKD